MVVLVPIRSSAKRVMIYVVDETGDSAIENANEGTDTVSALSPTASAVPMSTPHPQWHRGHSWDGQQPG